MPIRVILFDLDNTLLLEDEATDLALGRTSDIAAERTGADAGVIHAAAAAAAEQLFRAGPAFGYADAMGIWWGEALWGAFAGDAAGLQSLRAFVPRFRRGVWSHALAAAAVRDAALVDELVGAFGAARRAIALVDPLAEDTLEDLARDHRLGLITNGAGDVQREKLAATALAPRFDAIVISAELGVGKPDRRIFEAALAALGVPAGDAVVVGDSLDRDVAGAHRAGVRSVWLDRAGGGGSALPDATIGGLDELRGALLELERATLRRPA